MISADNGPVNIENHGLIDGGSRTAIYADGGGLVHNTGAIRSDGPSGAIEMYGASGDIVNSGTIVGENAVELRTGTGSILTHADGIMIGAVSTYNDTIENYGYIGHGPYGDVTDQNWFAYVHGFKVINHADGFIDGLGAGVYLEEGGTLRNDGMIESSAEGLPTATQPSARSRGVEVAGSGTVINNGTIRAHVNGLDPASNHLSVYGITTGSIYSTSDPGAVRVENYGDIIVEDAATAGIALGYSDGYILNSGRIIAKDTTSAIIFAGKATDGTPFDNVLEVKPGSEITGQVRGGVGSTNRLLLSGDSGAGNIGAGTITTLPGHARAIARGEARMGGSAWRLWLDRG